MTAVPGDKVEIITTDETISGTLMPENKDFVVVKLASGYNLGIHKHRVAEVHVVAKHQPISEDSKTTTISKGLPRIAILHTGGTIASKVDYETGGVISRFSPEELLGLFPELKNMANITSRLVRQMWSEDMRFAHYNILAREVVAEIKAGAHAVIITHGTDTLHYTSAALAFMLQHVPVPVLLVGAQRSSDRASSDAGHNLLSAVHFATATNFAEVAICMHENTNDTNCVILSATKSRKLHSSRRDAFKAVNTTPWARINPETREVLFLKTDYHSRKQDWKPEHVTARLFKEDIKVGLLKTHTNMYAEQFLSYRGWDGLVVEGFGIAGNPPINEIDDSTREHGRIYEALRELTSKGTVVASATQTIFGGINMNVYTTGRKMQQAGMIGNHCDMTAETAFVKLAWLLSNYPKTEAAELFSINLVGEISSRLEKEEH